MQTPGTDDRLDPEKATRAAAKHLHDLYAMFGDWYLAMAAYNCGPGCVQRAVERTGYADFWELTRLNALPKETANYVPVILALTIMAKNPKDYDLENLETDRPVEYETIDLDTPTSLALIADAADRPVSEIQDLNPALLKSTAPAGYQLRVPKGTLRTGHGGPGSGACQSSGRLAHPPGGCRRDAGRHRTPLRHRRCRRSRRPTSAPPWTAPGGRRW